MILDAILNFLFTPILAIFDMLPNITVVVPQNIFDTLNQITYGLGYVLPLKELLVLLAFKYGIISFTLIWRLILRIKSFIPGMGD